MYGENEIISREVPNPENNVQLNLKGKTINPSENIAPHLFFRASCTPPKIYQVKLENSYTSKHCYYANKSDSDTNAMRGQVLLEEISEGGPKSLGALRDTSRRMSYGTTGPQGVGQVSVIHNRRTDPGLLPLFPYISHIMNTRKSPNDDESTPLYSSYPSVKCDIVEYL
ncbi:uncharacterized protein CEXT_186511 [Caerostris extrusa]|uniref:Uncharacterized protein n=1 Tax=Caerostris extrusa TaxID=172846 RepID=A0AAV4SLD7_CAEEX|nr:uncharacterized protein CEXT_186511 [Caerostris extrusa]